ncbi:MAG TPA: DUF3810 family protein [Planctomycetota bacterium]|nr:DUF3810 family protein [Planctomycetota bacterium]
MSSESDPGVAGARVARAGRRAARATWGAAVLLGALLGLGRSSWFVEQVWARTLSPCLGIALGRASGLLPFSLADWVLVGLPVVLLVLVVRGSRQIVRERAWRPAVRSGATRLLRWSLAGALLFYATFGLGYGARPLAERLGWPAATPAGDRNTQADELAALCRAAVEATNVNYRAALGVDDLGEPSQWPGTRAELERVLDEGLAAAGTELGLDPWFAVSRGPSKRPLLSPLMRKLGISGFYFPWTGEANVNARTPGCDLVRVTAHEKAHQRGIAREDEAEFLGFLAGARAPHPYARYVAHRFAANLLLIELQKIDPARCRELYDELLPGARRDHETSREYYAREQHTRLTDIAITINHSYIRVHGDVRGVHAYGAAAELLIRYARLRGGRLP